MKKIYYTLLGIMIVLFSCESNDDGLFDADPAVRAAERNEELFALLTAEEQGYKGTYFTKNDEFGGFTFYMKFNENETVAMTSDFDTDTDIETSSFQVGMGTSTELVFTTRNHIQKLSNPEISELIGTGFKGTSVFQYFGQEEDGSLIFKDVRNESTSILRLTPSGFSDFETESVAAVNVNLLEEDNLLPLVTSSVFQVLEIDYATGTSVFNFNYDSFRNYVNAQITLDDGSVTEINFGVLFEENKMIISPALEFEGETYEEFVFNAVDRSYTSTVNGTTASILFGNEPAFLTKDYEEITGQVETFLYRPNLGSNTLTSPGHDNMMAEVNAGLNAVGFELYDYMITTDFNTEGDCVTSLRVLVSFVGDTSPSYAAYYCFKQATVEDRKIFFEYTGPDGGNGAYFESSMQPLLDFFNSSEGMVFTREGSFSSSLYSYINRAATFTSVEDPSIRVYGLFF